METGGMKGRKKEMVRDELHLILRKKYQCENIHSEYGMTELLSQAYAKTNGEFYSLLDENINSRIRRSLSYTLKLRSKHH